MKVNFNTSVNSTTPTFKTVNKQYLQQARMNYQTQKQIEPEWFSSLVLDTLKSKILKQDAIDTLKAAKDFRAKRNYNIYNLASKILQAIPEKKV